MQECARVSSIYVIIQYEHTLLLLFIIIIMSTTISGPPLPLISKTIKYQLPTQSQYAWRIPLLYTLL